LMDEQFEAVHGRAPNTDVSLFAPHYERRAHSHSCARWRRSIDSCSALGLCRPMLQRRG
jgi:hypothetical protein